MLPDGKGMPADNAVFIQPAIIAREAGRTTPLVLMKRESKIKEPHLA
jgi:hypothetical protein